MPTAKDVSPISGSRVTLRASLAGSRAVGRALTDGARAGGRASPASSIAETQANFERQMDLWGAYHRTAVASVTMLVTFCLLAQPDWLLWLGVAYIGVSALVPTVLAHAPTVRARAWLRCGFMLIDVLAVSMFVYRWGPRASPAPIMYVPIVSGWTLIPQRHLGRMAVGSVLLAYAGVLLSQSLGVHEHAVEQLTGLWGAASSPLLWFAMLACALAAVHGLVDFTVARLQEHNLVVFRLSAEKLSRERESLLEAQLEEAQRLEALGRLAGGVAHDFNNLLTVLMGCAELAERNLGKDNALAGRSLQDLQSAAERGASLTAELLDFASRRPASPSDVDLNVLVRSAAKLLERLLDANITLRVRTHDEPCVVHLDPAGMERLLLNLAINARDAMPQGGALELALSLKRTSTSEQVVLEVSDTGVGIASADLPRIFEPFFTTKERGKGTGLGLASVYGLVKQSEGQIEVESRVQAGTTFRISWPRVRGAALGSEPERPDPSRGEEQILLVDDDPDVRAVALAQLESAGYAVISASSGNDALHLLARHGALVDMLVSDVSMPGMSGVELARKVRALSPELPILLISGYSEELHGGAERVGRFLAKPFSGQKLLTEVRSALDSKV